VIRNAEGAEVATGTAVRAPIPGDLCRLEALVMDVPPSDTYEVLTGGGWRVGTLSRPADRDGCATVDVIVIEGDLAVVDQPRSPEEQFAETCVLRGGST
jgi:hypothetical protein